MNKNNSYCIIFFTNSLSQGGVESEIMNLAAEYSKDHDVFIKCFLNNISNRNRELADLLGITILVTPKLFGLIDLRYLNYFYPFRFRVKDYEVVKAHFTDIMTLFKGLSFCRKYKNVIWNLGLYHLKEYQLPTQFISWKYYRKLVRDFNPKQILCANKQTSSIIQEIFNLESNTSIKPLLQSVDEGKINVGLNRDIDVLIVARLVVYKPYISDLIKYFNNTEYKVFIIGDGVMRKALEDTSTNNISFVGFVEGDELIKYYSTSKLLIGNGTVALEAVKYGCPSILVPDQGLDYGYFGWFHDFDFKSYSYTRLNNPSLNSKEANQLNFSNDIRGFLKKWSLDKHSRKQAQCTAHFKRCFDYKESLKVFENSFYNPRFSSWNYILTLIILIADLVFIGTFKFSILKNRLN